MSVLIEGMEMPKSCYGCALCHPLYHTSYCAVANRNCTPLREKKAWCPLVPVPPHGRLIDADALIIDLMDRGIEGIQTDDWYEIQQAVMDAPTIIQA